MAEIILLTEEEASERLRCSISRVAQLRVEGELPYLVGPTILIPEYELNEYIRGSLIQRPRADESRSSPNSTPVLSLTELDRRRAEVTKILEEIYKQNSGTIYMTPAVEKLLDTVKDHPASIAARKAAQVAWVRYQNRELGLKASGEPRGRKTAQQAAAATKKRVKAAYKRKLAKQATKAAAAGSPPITKRAEAARRRRLAAKRRADAERHHANKSPSGSS